MRKVRPGRAGGGASWVSDKACVHPAHVTVDHAPQIEHVVGPVLEESGTGRSARMPRYRRHDPRLDLDALTFGLAPGT